MVKSIPVVAVNEALTKTCSTIATVPAEHDDGLIRAKNVLLAGRTIVVGAMAVWDGAGLRRAGKGAQVIVTEVDRRVRSRPYGRLSVMPLDEAANEADIIITHRRRESRRRQALRGHEGRLHRRQLGHSARDQYPRVVKMSREQRNAAICRGLRISRWPATTVADGRVMNLGLPKASGGGMDMRFANQRVTVTSRTPASSRGRYEVLGTSTRRRSAETGSRRANRR